jgi:hypothetical protein
LPRAVGSSPRRRVRRKRKRHSYWRKCLQQAWRKFGALPRSLSVSAIVAATLLFLAAGNFAY